MIALNEPLATAAEVPFFLPLATNPIAAGLTGHSFSLGEVQVHLPGGVWFNVSTGQIVEKGFGRYAVQLTAAQCAVAGQVYVNAVVSGAQPYDGSEEVGTAGGDIGVGVAGVFPVFLANATDPINGAPITGHSWATGEVQVCLPGGSYANADVTKISEVGLGNYELALSTAQTAARGKIYLIATVSGAQRFEGWVTVLNPGGIPLSTGGSTAVPAPTTTASGVPALVNHAAAAHNRLAQQFRSS